MIYINKLRDSKNIFACFLNTIKGRDNENSKQQYKHNFYATLYKIK